MKVGIAAPMYNVQDYIEEFLESVLAQTYPAFALSLYDDGSADRTYSRALGVLQKTYGEESEHIKFIAHKDSSNEGWATAMNGAVGRLIKRFGCELIFIANSDDILQPTLLEETVAAIGDYDWVCMPIRTTDGVVHRPVVEAKWEDYLEQNKMTNFSLIKASMWKDLGGYDENLCKGNGFEDWDFWLRAVKAGYKPTYLDRELYLYRQHENQTSRKVGQDCIDAIIKKHS